MIARSIFQTSAAQIATTVFGVITGVFVTRLLGPEGRGVFALFKANAEFLALFLGFGLASVIIYFASNRKHTIPELTGVSVLGLSIGTGLAFVILGVLNALDYDWIYLPEGFQSVYFILYLVAIFNLTLFGTILNAFLNARKHFRETNLVRSILTAAFCLGVVALFFFFRQDIGYQNVVNVLWLNLFLGFINVAVLGVLFFVKLREEIGITYRVMSVITSGAALIYLVYLGELINFFNYRLDLWIVQYFEAAYQLGLYTLAVSMSQMLWIIALSVSTVLLPFLNDPDSKEDSESLFFFIRDLHFPRLQALPSC